MIRPYKISEAIIALAGAGLLLVLGLLSPAVAIATLLRDWNTFFFFLGMMSLSTLAEVAGLFDWLAVQAARLSGNSSRRLFFNTFLLRKSHLDAAFQRCHCPYFDTNCV